MHSIKNIYEKVLNEAGGQPGLSTDEIENMSDSFKNITMNYPLKEIENGIFYGRFDKKSLSLWNEKDGSGGRGEYTVASHFLKSDFEAFERKSVDRFFIGLNTDFTFHGEIGFGSEDNIEDITKKFKAYLLELNIELCDIDLTNKSNKKNIELLKSDPRKLGKIRTFQLKSGESRWDTVLRKINKMRFLRDLDNKNPNDTGFNPSDIGLYDLLSSVTTSGVEAKSTDVAISRDRIKKDFIDILDIKKDNMTIEVKEISDITNTVDGGSGIRLASGSRLEAMKNDIIFCLTILCIITDISSEDQLFQDSKELDNKAKEVLVSLKNNQVPASKVKDLIFYLSHPSSFRRVLQGLNNLMNSAEVSSTKKELGYSTIRHLENMFSREMSTEDRNQIITKGLSTSIANSIKADYFCIIHGHDSSKYRKNPSLLGKDHFILIRKDRYKDVLGFGSYQNGGTAYATLKNKKVASFFRILFSSNSMTESLKSERNVYNRREMFIKKLISEKNYKNNNLFLNSFSHLYNKKLNEGIFHMMHPYEYHSSNEFKLGGLLEIINEIEDNTLKASEKLDGQNLWFSFRDGNPVFAYNMKELQAGGVDWNRLSEPYVIQDKKDVPKEFSGLEKIIRPHIKKDEKLIPSHGGYASFKDGVEVIHHCLVDAYSRDPQLIDFIFKNGKNFSSSEVIHAEGPNQILYGENFIAPHFVMDKSGEQYLDKYKKLFSLLKFEQDKVKNPKGFKLLTREQRDEVALQIMEFEDEKEKLLFVKDLRDEYQKRIHSLINNTSLTLESTVKDFHRYHLVNYIKTKGEQDLALDESFVDSLLLFIHGSTLKASGLNNIPDYKNKIKRLQLGNARDRGAFKSSYIGDIVEIFFDFGIDINRGIKTTATSSKSQDINHQRIVATNLNNIKKAFVIAKEIEIEANRLTQLGQEENAEHKKLFSLARKLKFQIAKVKSVIKRVKQGKGFSSNKDTLTFIVSSSIEGLVLNRKIPDSDSVMELKLTGFFAPLNQVLNAIRFEVGHVDLLDQFLESDGQIFSLNNQNIPTTHDIESLLEKKLLNKAILTKSNFSLLEMYNLKTYSETQQNEFDISVVPMSAKPFTIGHEDLVKTACEKSKEVYVVISTTSRMREYENPITGDAMEKLYFEGNPAGFVPDLETLLNNKIPECRGKVKVVYSKNPVTDVTSIFEEDFAYENLEKDKKYCIIVGDIEDAKVYSPEQLQHMEDNLNVIYRDDNDERLSSGTRTRASLNTGRFNKETEIPIKSRPGQTKIERNVMLVDPYQEDTEMYDQSFAEFAKNLSNIYDMKQKKRIYDYVSEQSRNAIDNFLYKMKDIQSNKEAKEKLSKEELKMMKALGRFKRAKQLSMDYEG